MVKGIHILPRVSPGPALPDPSMPCRRVTAETALWPFQGWPARRADGLRPSSTPLDTRRGADLIELTPYDDTSDVGMTALEDDGLSQFCCLLLVVRAKVMFAANAINESWSDFLETKIEKPEMFGGLDFGVSDVRKATFGSDCVGFHCGAISRLPEICSF
jgi:hypothetical protein